MLWWSVLIVLAGLLDYLAPLNTGPTVLALDPLTLILGGLGIFNWLNKGGKNKNQGTAIQPGTPLYDYLTTGMIPGGGGGGGSSTSTTRQNMLETRNLNTTTMPQIAPEYQTLQGLLRGIMEGRLRNPQGLPPGMEALGIQNINQGFTGARSALENRLSSSGQYGSPGPTAAAFANLEGQRAQGINQYRLSLPTLARQFQDQDINMAAMLNQVFGLGQSQTQRGTIRTQGTSTTQGSSGGGGGGPRFDPSGPLTYLQMQQQQANQPGFLDQLLPLLGLLLGSGGLSGGRSTGGGTAAIGGNAGG